MAGAAPSRSMGERMVFVVGARRSGTNWIGRIIGTHPDVASITNESYLFHSLGELERRFQHGSKGSWQLATIYVDRPVLVDALRAFCDTVLSTVLDEAPGQPQRLLERTPDHWRQLRLIGEVYPDAHVVHIVRDGRDVARSLVAMPWGPDDLADAAQEWVDAVQQGRAEGQRLQHYTEVRYEELLADPRGGVAALFDALDLPITDALVEELLAEAGVAYNHDPGMPIAPAKWTTALDAAQLATIEAVAGPTLLELGFTLAGADGGPPATPDPGEGLAARVAHGLLRRSRRRSPDAEGPGDEPPAAIDAPVVLDTFLAHLRSGRADDALAMIDASARVHLVQGGVAWEGRGGDAPARLVRALSSDPALSGPQPLSDVWPSVPAFTVVLTAEGDARLRVLVVYLAGERIAHAAYYTPVLGDP
jgi:hypothetical protein